VSTTVQDASNRDAERQRARHVVCRADELGPGDMRELKLGVRKILVVRTPEDEYLALSGYCAHQGGPLIGGTLERMWISDEVGKHVASENRWVVICPWHNFETECRTGCSPIEPHRLRSPTYQAVLEDDKVVVYV
jgi:nitrite reductase (NADH) small subunit